MTLGELLAPLEGAGLGAELDAIRRVAAGATARVYLVGGLVRDLLLGRSSRDIDLAVAGPVEELAERLTGALGGEVRRHPAFMTASFETRHGYVVDVARMRRESYREPAALPEVAPGSLEEDLFRRDFSVNAMAIAVDLAADDSPLIDLHDGRRDLAAGRLRVLHPASFRDDPTRVLRGLRIAGRSGLAFDEPTLRLAAEPETRAALATVSGFRLWRELESCFYSAGAARRAIAALADLGLTAAIHPALADRSSSFDAGAGAAPVELLAAWAGGLDRAQRRELAERLALTREERRVVAPGVSRPRGRGRR